MSNRNRDLEKISQIASKSDIEKLIDRAVQPYSRYQILLTILLCINVSVVAIHDTIPAFYGYTPDEFTCSSSSNQTSNVCTPDCEDYKFNDPDTSIVTDWSLVCDKKYLVALSTTIYFIGITFGSFGCGVLGDLWGRRTLLFVCVYVQAIFGISIYFAESFTIFLVLRFIQGFFIQGLQGIAFTLIQEIAPAHKLTLTGFIFLSFWVLGEIYLGVVAYFVRDWRILQLLTNIPALLTLLWCWVLPESPTWHLANNRKLEALKSISKATSSETFDEVLFNFRTEGNEKEEILQEKAGMKDLFKNKILLKHLLVQIVSWFAVTLSYYGILFYLPNLPGGRHYNYLVLAVIDEIGYIISYFTLSTRMGRRHSIIVFQYCGALACLLLGLLTFMPPETSWKMTATLVIACIGKLFSCATFSGIFASGIELFPTILRASAGGIYGIGSRIGSFLAPQILLIGDLTHPMVGMAIMAVSLLIGGTLTFLTPETLNQKLPNTLDDVEKTWGKNKTYVSRL